MDILKTIVSHSEDSSKPFLVIGGHAINYYGLSRQTGDVDLIVRKDDKDWWVDTLSRLKYSKFQNDEFFTRFKPNSLGEWPIDLMYVNSETFEKMFESSELGDVGLAKARIVSARHLATLKIHALDSEQAHREVKDYTDLLWLLDSGKTGLGKPELKELCERYAKESLYDRIVSDWKTNYGS